MAATNFTAIYKNVYDEKLIFDDYQAKMTYKTALAVAKELTKHGTCYELICVIETNKIMSRNVNKEEKTE